MVGFQLVNVDDYRRDCRVFLNPVCHLSESVNHQVRSDVLSGKFDVSLGWINLQHQVPSLKSLQDSRLVVNLTLPFCSPPQVFPHPGKILSSGVSDPLDVFNSTDIWDCR
jgi:hypothetical protein